MRAIPGGLAAGRQPDRGPCSRTGVWRGLPYRRRAAVAKKARPGRGAEECRPAQNPAARSQAMTDSTGSSDASGAARAVSASISRARSSAAAARSMRSTRSLPTWRTVADADPDTRHDPDEAGSWCGCALAGRPSRAVPGIRTVRRCRRPAIPGSRACAADVPSSRATRASAGRCAAAHASVPRRTRRHCGAADPAVRSPRG